MARLVLTFLVLSLLMVGVVGAVSYLRARSSLETQVFDRLDAAAQLKADSLDRWLDEQRRNTVFVSGLLGGYISGDASGLGAATQTVLAGGPAARSGRARPTRASRGRSATSSRRRPTRRSSSSSTSTATSSPRPCPTTRDATRRRRVVPEGQLGHLRSARRHLVADRQADDHGRHAAVRPQRPAHRHRRRQPQPRAPRPDRAARHRARQDRRLLPRRQERALRPRGLDTGTFAAGVSSTGIDRAIAGNAGRGLYDNYQGVPVIGSYRWLDEVGAGLVAEQDQHAAFAPARTLAVTIGGVGLLVAGAARNRHVSRVATDRPPDPRDHRHRPGRRRRRPRPRSTRDDERRGRSAGGRLQHDDREAPRDPRGARAARRRAHRGAARSRTSSSRPSTRRRWASCSASTSTSSCSSSSTVPARCSARRTATSTSPRQARRRSRIGSRPVCSNRSAGGGCAPATASPVRSGPPARARGRRLRRVVGAEIPRSRRGLIGRLVAVPLRSGEATVGALGIARDPADARARSRRRRSTCSSASPSSPRSRSTTPVSSPRRRRPARSPTTRTPRRASSSRP